MLPWLKEKIAAKKKSWSRSKNEETTKEEHYVECKDENEIENETDLTLKIINPRSGIVMVKVAQTDNGCKIKEKVLRKLESSHLQSAEEIQFYKLIRSCTKKQFKDTDSLVGHNVRNNEEFLLIGRRADNIDILLNVQNCRGPTEKEIFMKTKHLPLIRAASSVNNTMDPSLLFQSDLQNDLRKILCEIAKSSAFVLGPLPYAEKLIKYYRQKILMSLCNHQEVVKMLCDMGYSLDNVLKALKLQSNNYNLAMDWLVENIETNDQSPRELPSPDELPETCLKKQDKKLISPSLNSIFNPKHKFNSIQEKVDGLLEIVKYYNEKNDEMASQETINLLLNMGFVLDDIEEALRKTSNNQTAACEWLLENSSITNQNLNLLRESIFVESHILKILLNTPQIQMSLSNPKMFIAYISMLENYSTINIWFNDPESTNLLQHILRTYHEEKHIIAINQLNMPQL